MSVDQHMGEEAWTVADAVEEYGVDRWSGGYFRVLPNGELSVSPDGTADGPSVSLLEVVKGLRARGLNPPVLLRITGILEARLRLLNETFRKVMEQYGYSGGYRGVYPIKVNQRQQIVQSVADTGAAFHHGLEAGSKAELIAAVSYLHDPEAYLICNGYKDAAFVDLGLYALKMGVRCVFVIETPEECRLIIRRARSLGVKPILGVRLKLSSRGSGHWSQSGGDRSVFGLNTVQLLEAVEELRDAGFLDGLHLLHFHLGSQISDIRDVRLAATEAARIYAGVAGEGAALRVLDLGGGLAVDYDGTHSPGACSCNYSLEEYCAAVTEAVMVVMDEAEVPHPVLMTESGRATVAHYSMLLFNILDVSRFEVEAPPVPGGEAAEEESEAVAGLRDVVARLEQRDPQECYHDAVYYRDEARQLFRYGSLPLRERALAEQLFWHVLTRLALRVRTMEYVPEELEGLERLLADIYYGNFSLFQSLPDMWAIDQLFPIMPIHRLNERPERRAILSDITCDCDGRIDRFVGDREVLRTLALHALRPGEEYMLGVFLVGAYQETLGDLHNLLGDTNVASIHLDADGEIEYTREIEGDKVANVLSYVGYETPALMQRLRLRAEEAVRRRSITVEERQAILGAYRRGLEAYTYFEP